MIATMRNSAPDTRKDQQTWCIAVTSRISPGGSTRDQILKPATNSTKPITRVVNHRLDRTFLVCSANAFFHHSKGFLILVATAQARIEPGINATPPPTTTSIMDKDK